MNAFKTIICIITSVVVVYGILFIGDNNSHSSKNNNTQIIEKNVTSETFSNFEEDSLSSPKEEEEGEFISVGTGTVKLKNTKTDYSTSSTLTIKK
jgi:hypothetical protein